MAIRVVEMARIIKAGMLALTQEGTDSHILSISPLARRVWSGKGLALDKPGAEEIEYGLESAARMKDTKGSGYTRPVRVEADTIE